MIGKVIIGIIALFLLIGAFRTPIIDGIKGWRTSDTTQNAVVDTAAGVTSANVTLDYDLYQAKTAEVYDIGSTIEETPAAATYIESTKVLLINGLTAETSRTLDVNYYAETDDMVMQIIGPFLAFGIFGGVGSLIIFAMWKKR